MAESWAGATRSGLGATPRKAQPVLSACSGMQFPVELRPESVSQSGLEFWDAISASKPNRKARPILSVDSGSQFPLGGPTGNCDPFLD